MHSGIGDKAKLKQFGIKPIHHLPSIGRNASDHPLVSIDWRVNSMDTFDEVRRNATIFNEAFKYWNTTYPHQGLFSTVGTPVIIWKRLAKYLPIFKQFHDPSAGPKSPHIELIFRVC